MAKYYFNVNIEVTENEYKELYKQHYKRGVDLSPSKFLKKTYYATCNNYVFRVEK